MIIYLALFVPLLTAVVLLLFFKHRMAWFEYSIPFVVSVILIVASKAITESVQTRDKEFWGSNVRYAEYYEDWNEYIRKTCTESYSCGTDSKGNTKYCTRTYDCSYVDYHPAYWKIKTTSNEEISISSAEYAHLTRQFGNEEFVELSRNYHSDDGDKYVTAWRGERETARPVVTEHLYENRVQASDDVFNFAEVGKEDVAFYGLHNYPEVRNYQCRTILGFEDALAEKELRFINGDLGPIKQVRIWVIVFNGKSRDTGLLQESYWKGGNKNEFVVTIGIDSLSRKVQWCYPFSWTEEQRLKIDVRNFVESQGELNLLALAKFLETNIEQSFERKQFADFDYLTVEPPLLSVFITFLLTVALNLGLSWWAIKNELH